jgi:hypothetical protein
MVEPLPPYAQEVHAVGNFKSLKASVDHATARVGEAIVYTLEVEGTGNIQTMPPPKLVLPEEFNFYDSKQGLSKLPTEGYKKRYEYIIQASKPGEWTLPAQTLTYFDPTSRVYKKLKSNSCIITVKPLVSDQPVAHEQVDKINQNMQSANAQFLPLAQDSWTEMYDPLIPWRIFILLILLPWFICALYGGYTWYGRTRQASKNVAIKEIRKKIENAVKESNYTHLYEYILQLFALQLGLDQVNLSHERLLQELQPRGLSQQELSSLENFFTTILSYSFYTQNNLDGQTILEQTYNWLKRMGDLA